MGRNRYLLVIDMQNDFIDGALGTKEAEGIVGNVARAVREFDGAVAYTMDTHRGDYLDTQEGRLLPVVHCVEGTKGWEVRKEVEKALNERDAVGFRKPTFGSRDLAEFLVREDKREPIEEICLVGLCTDICVISNALLLKAYLPETPIKVLSSCCAGVTPESHENALSAMRACQVAVE